MSEPGWYPDPGGRSGHYRFWDGRTWSSVTSSQIPGGPPTGPGGPPGPPRRRRTGLVIGIAALIVVVLVVVGVLVLRPGRAPVADPVPASTTGPTAGGSPSGASSSPTVAPTTPTPSTSPSGQSARPSSSCPVGDPFARQDHPNDGRVHGGGLSIPRQEGWADPGVQTDAFTWAYDVGETDLKVQPEWYSSYVVGALSVADGFEDPRSAAELTLQCTLSSSLYRNVLGPPEMVERETTVAGRPAFTVVADVRVDDDRTTFEGDTVVITVVDLGSPEALAFFWGCAPIGDTTLGPQLDRVSKQLEVD